MDKKLTQEELDTVEDKDIQLREDAVNTFLRALRLLSQRHGDDDVTMSKVSEVLVGCGLFSLLTAEQDIETWSEVVERLVTRIAFDFSEEELDVNFEFVNTDPDRTVH